MTAWEEQVQQYEYLATNPLPPEAAPEGVVYFARAGKGWLEGYTKIGFSRHLYCRLYELQSALQFKLELIHFINTDEPAWAETDFHQMFEPQHLPIPLYTEWYALLDLHLAWVRTIPSVQMSLFYERRST